MDSFAQRIWDNQTQSMRIRAKLSHLVIMDYALRHSLVQHLLVPFLQAFRLGDLLVQWVTVEDVVIPFTRRTGPDMPCCKPETGRQGAFYIKLSFSCN